MANSLKDFHLITNPDIKQLIGNVIFRTRRTKWLITTQKLLSLNSDIEMISDYRIGAMSLNFDLTQAQFDLLIDLANGATLDQLVQSYGLTRQTIINRRSLLLGLLNLNDSAHLGQFAAQHGLLFKNNGTLSIAE